MSDQNITTLLIKLPVGLKSSFAGLCSARGVSVSEELRRFMADELVGAVSGMATQDRVREDVPPKVTKAVKKTTKQTKAKSADQPTRCDETNDMFDDPSELARREGMRADIDAKREERLNTPKNASKGKFKLSDGVMNGIKAKDSRKKSNK